MLVYATDETYGAHEPCESEAPTAAPKDAVEELCARSIQTPGLLRFLAFHRDHPEVLDFLVQEARLLLKNGHRAFSFHSLFQYCRWKIVLEKGPRSYKLNDHLSPYYARVIVILHPEFNGLAEFRGSGPNEVFGVVLEPAAEATMRCRRLVWANGTALEDGWRPSRPHVPVHTPKRKRNVH